MPEYYIVYSIDVATRGTGMGRTCITRDRPIETMDDIQGVEQAVLDVCKEKEPTTRNLFLISWTELRR